MNKTPKEAVSREQSKEEELEEEGEDYSDDMEELFTQLLENQDTLHDRIDSVERGFASFVRGIVGTLEHICTGIEAKSDLERKEALQKVRKISGALKSYFKTVEE